MIGDAFVPADASSVPSTVMPALADMLIVVPAATVTVTPASMVVGAVSVIVPDHVVSSVISPAVSLPEPPPPPPAPPPPLPPPPPTGPADPTVHEATANRAMARTFFMSQL